MTLRTLLALAAVLFAAPATAGNLSYSNGQTQWEATGCQQPMKPNFANGGSRTLNANMEAYNLWTRSVETYLQCIATEANADMQASNNGITQQLNQVNQAWQGELNAQAAIMGDRRHP